MSVSDGSVERAKSEDKRQQFPWLAHSSPSLGRNNQVLQDVLVNHGKTGNAKRELSACGKDRCQDENMRLTTRENQESCRDVEINMLRNKQIADAIEIERLKEQIQTLLGSQKGREGEDDAATHEDQYGNNTTLGRCNGKQEIIEESAVVIEKCKEGQQEEKVSSEGQGDNDQNDDASREIKAAPSGETNQEHSQQVENACVSSIETATISEKPLENTQDLSDKLLNGQMSQSKEEVLLDGNVSQMIDSILLELTSEALGMTNFQDDPFQSQKSRISCQPSESANEGNNSSSLQQEQLVNNQEQQPNYYLKYTELLDKFEFTEQIYDSLRKQDHQESEKLSKQVIALESKLSLSNMRNAALVQEKSILLGKLAEAELRGDNQNKKYAEIVAKFQQELKRITERLELKEFELHESNEKKLQFSSKLIEYSEVLSEYRQRLQETERQLEEQRASISEPIQNINMVFNIIANYKQTLQRFEMEISQLIGEHKRYENERQGDLAGQLKRKNEQLSECCRMLKESKERMSKIMRENSWQTRIMKKIFNGDARLESLLEEDEVHLVNGLRNQENKNSSRVYEAGQQIASKGQQRGNRIFEGSNITPNVVQYVIDRDQNKQDNHSSIIRRGDYLNSEGLEYQQEKNDQQMQQISQEIQERDRNFDKAANNQI